ncbi:hypothetical protein BBJ28_00019011 [Nothophytophthora sp. Chile5]|nr:hypothetical protein BBJ28_00019011 [Nothophytophthora sp. Chile5]
MVVIVRVCVGNSSLSTFSPNPFVRIQQSNMEENGDAAFLAEVRALLGDYEAPLIQEEGHGTATDGDALLLDSHRLLAETEALLSSFSAPSVAPVSVQEPEASQSTAQATSPQNTVKGSPQPVQTLDERRRAARNAQAAKRRVKYRQRLKDEWQLLRQQESELSMELSNLQKAQAQAKALRGSSLALPVWRTIAVLQREKRREVETQQEGLRAAVASQAMVLQHMKGLLHQILSVDQPERLKPCENHAVRMERHETALFEDFLQELEPLYAQTDEVFDACGLEREPSASLFFMPIYRKHQGTAYFESKDTMQIPFDFPRTCSAVSKLMLNDPIGCQHFDGAKNSKNTEAMKFRAKYRWDSGEVAHMTIYTAMKIYQEADRLVYVWRALTEGQGVFAGMHANETGWFVVRPSTVADENVAGNGANGGVSTLLESYSRFVPMHLGKSSNCKGAVDRFAELMMRSGAEEAAELTRTLRNLLIRDNGAVSAATAP